MSLTNLGVPGRVDGGDLLLLVELVGLGVAVLL